jgi:hypothetical protein
LTRGRRTEFVDVPGRRRLKAPALDNSCELPALLDVDGKTAIMVAHFNEIGLSTRAAFGWREERLMFLDPWDFSIQILATTIIDGMRITAAANSSGTCWFFRDAGRTMRMLFQAERKRSTSVIAIAEIQERCVVVLGSPHGECEVLTVDLERHDVHSLGTLDFGSSIRSVTLMPAHCSVVASCEAGLACIRVHALDRKQSNGNVVA